MTINRFAFSYTIHDDSQIEGMPANLAADLPASIATGVGSQSLAIAYSSSGDTGPAAVGAYPITGSLSNGTGLLANYNVTLTNGTLTVNDAIIKAGSLTPPTGSGLGTDSTFASAINEAGALTFDVAGNLYVGSMTRGAVKKVTPAGVVSTYASGFNVPSALAFDAAGNLYVANGVGNTVSKVTPTGVVSTFATGFHEPTGLVFTPNGTLFVSNYSSNSVSKVTSAGLVSTFATGLNGPSDLTFSAGKLYVANFNNNTVSKVTSTGVVSTYATGFNGAEDLRFNATGTLFIANAYSNRVSKVTPAETVIHQSFSNETVFNFTDGDSYDTASDFTAVIALGNGVTVTLTSTPSVYGQIVADAFGGFDVQLSYTYSAPLTNATFSVTVTDLSGASISASTNTFDVAI